MKTTAKGIFKKKHTQKNLKELKLKLKRLKVVKNKTNQPTKKPWREANSLCWVGQTKGNAHEGRLGILAGCTRDSSTVRLADRMGFTWRLWKCSLQSWNIRQRVVLCEIGWGCKAFSVSLSLSHTSSGSRFRRSRDLLRVTRNSNYN